MEKIRGVKLVESSQGTKEYQLSNLAWANVSIRDVFNKNSRLEAAVYTKSNNAKGLALSDSSLSLIPMSKLMSRCFYPGRFKRVYVEKEYGEPFFLPSQLNEVDPKPAKFLSHSQIQNAKEDLRVYEGQLLVTRSGTIGNATIVSKTLDGGIFSDDVIRMEGKPEDIAYIYTLLKSPLGKQAIQSNNYGAVIKHIEPEHLAELSIPNPSSAIKERIFEHIRTSFELRDKANLLLDEAQTILIDSLNLPPIEELSKGYLKSDKKVKSFVIKASDLAGRLEASYHNPSVGALETSLEKSSAKITDLADPQLVQELRLPGRFKRVYVEEGEGIVYFSGKNISELNPNDKRYLAYSQHDRLIKDKLTIQEGMILVTCSGTVGQVAFVPRHWDGWAMTHDIIRLIPKNIDCAGYLYAWLNTDYARILLNRYSYGAVVPHLEIEHVSKVLIPLLQDVDKVKLINDRALDANKLRFEAYQHEQEALDVFHKQVMNI